MAVPEGRTSRSRTRSRRAQWKVTPVQLVRMRIDGVEQLVPARLRKAAVRELLR